MKNIIFLIFLIFTICTVFGQNSLRMAPNFNNNKPFVDKQYQEYSHKIPMRFRELNDSSIVYYGNMRDENWNNQNQRIFIRTFKSNRIDDFYDILVEDFNAGPPMYNAEISDILVNSSGDIFVIQNDYQTVKVHKYVFNSNDNNYELIWTKQSNNNPLQENAKAYLTNDSKVVLFALQNFRDISRIEISADGQMITTTTLVDNNGDTISKIGDVFLMANGSVLIADNAYVQTQGIVSQINRIIKINANGSLDQNFYNNGIRYLEELNVYNIQFPGIYESSSINKISEDNGKILIVGHDAVMNNAGFPIKKGFVYRLNSDGSPDNTFSEDGLYNPSLEDFGYQNFQFNDIKKTNNNKYLLFGGGRKVVLGDIGLVCSINVNGGTEDNTVGNFGKIFENKIISNINHAKIFYSSSGNTYDAQIFVMGVTDSSFVFSNRGSFLPTTCAAKMVWNNQSSTSVSSIFSPKIQFYPNPANSVLNIKLLGAATVQVFSIEGKLLLETKAKANIHIINISSLPSGIYLLKTNNQTIKFIKE